MHQSRENIELVLQEVCVQHRSVETMRHEVIKVRSNSITPLTWKILSADSLKLVIEFK